MSSSCSGPRGTGKSTWLAEQCPDAVLLNLPDPAVLRAYPARPERLKERLAASAEADTLCTPPCGGTRVRL